MLSGTTVWFIKREAGVGRLVLAGRPVARRASRTFLGDENAGASGGLRCGRGLGGVAASATSEVAVPVLDRPVTSPDAAPCPDEDGEPAGFSRPPANDPASTT
jgi:hypothetical protein